MPMEAKNYFNRNINWKVKSSLMMLFLFVFTIGAVYGQDKERKYADNEEVRTTSLLGIGGDVNNAENAVNGNPREHSTLSVGIGALNAFYARQFLDFGETIAAGTPVTIKFSAPTSTVGLADNFSFQPYTNLREEDPILGSSYWTADEAGGSFTGGNLLTLLGGVGTHEITITPEEDFEGIWVNLSSALGLAMNMELYHAYVEEDASEAYTCEEGNSAIDVLSGIDAGTLDVAGGLGSVENPYNVIDDPDAYSTMSVVAGALNSAYHTTLFQSPSEVNQVVRVVLEQDGGLADVGVLSAFTIQPLLEGEEVGDPIAGNSSLVNLSLFGGTDRYELAIQVEDSFDALKLELNNTVSLLYNIRIFEVSRMPRVILSDDEEAFTNCGSLELVSEDLIFNYEPDYYEYLVYESATGGDPLDSTEVSASGTYYIEAIDEVIGCVSLERAAVEVTITEGPEAPVLVSNTIWVGVEGTASIAVDTPNENLTYNWYDEDGNSLPDGEDTDTYEATGITGEEGDITTILVEAVDDEGCEGAERTEVSLQIMATPTIDPAELSVKQGETATLTTVFNTLNAPDDAEILWYDEDGNQVNASSTSDPEYTIPDDLDPGEYTYSTQIRDPESGAVSESVAVVVTVLDDIAPPIVTPPSATYTEGYTETFTASHDDFDNSELTYTWYDADGNEVANTPEFTTPDDLAIGDYVYTVTATDEATDRVSEPTEVPVTVEELAAPGVDPTSANYTEGETETFTASHDDPDVTYTWYDADGNEVGNTPEFTTPADLAAGNYVYTVTATDPETGIESEPTPVDVSVVEPGELLPPTVDPETVSIVEGETASFTASSENTDPVEYVWYDEEGTQVFVGDDFTTPDDLPIGTHTYEVTSRDIDNSDRESVATSVEVIVQAAMLPPEISPTETTITEGETAEFTATSDNNDPVEYVWYDDEGTEVFVGDDFTTPDDLLVGTYTYEVTSRHPDNEENESSATEITVTVEEAIALEAPVVTPTNATIEEGEAVTYTATTDYPNGVVVWKDEDGNEIATGEDFIAGPGLTAGNYTYSAVVRDPDTDEESDPTSVSLTITEPAVVEDCLPAYERSYATNQTSSGGVAQVQNPGAAVDGNLDTFSVIQVPSLGQTFYQTLEFGQSFSASNGDELHVRIGTQVGLTVGSITVEIQAYDDANAVGTPLQLSGGLLNLLSGANRADLVVPDPGTSFDAVRISVTGGLLSAGDVGVYEGYVNQEVETLAACEPVEDILIGSTSGALGSLNGVENENNAADGDIESFTRLRQNVGVDGYVHLTNIYSSPSVVGDSIRVTLADQDAGLIDLGVATGLKIVAYKGNTPVHEVSVEEGLLDLKLLGGGNQYEVRTMVDEPFDRVSIQLGGIASALEGVNIYEIERVPGVSIEGNDPGDTFVEACPDGTVNLDAPGDSCTSYVWYDEAFGGNVIGDGNLEFEIPEDWEAGEHTVYVQPVRYGCEEGLGRTEVTIDVQDAPGADAIVVEAGSDAYCEGESVGITATAAGIDDPVFTWYLDENKEDPVADADGVSYKISNGELEISGLPVGEHTYYVSVSDGADGCESIAGDLAEVSVTVNAGATQSDIVTAGSVICFGETATLEASSNTIDNPVFNWYENADLEDAPFTGAIFEQEDLAAGEHTYYVTVSGDGVCESSAEEAVAVIIEVQHQITSDDIELPGGLSQCLGSEVMLSAGVAAGLDVDTPEFTWYLDAEGTQELSDGELDGATYTINNGELTIDGLTTGDINYYVGLDGDNVCGSLDGGLAMVTVSIGEDLAAPEVAATEVSVCIGEDTTLSILNPQDNLTYNWYTEESGGTVEFTGSDVDLTDVTEDATYYVEAVGDGGCESLTRTQVTVIVNDYATAADIEVTGETSVCEGTDVVLTPSSAIADPVIRWYEDADKLTEITEGVAANGVLTVSGLEAGDYTFYASVEGAELCENEAGDLAEIAINVGSAQEAPVVTPPEQYVIVGETPEAFEVVDLDSGEAVWYSDADLSTEVARGNSYVPSSGSEGSFTYYVVVEEGPCVSEVTEVVLHVTGMPTPPEECYIADGESHGTTFGCVLCSVQDPTHAIDDNPDNFSRLVLPIGLGSGSVYQTLEFSHMGKAGDSVVVDMALPGGLADVNIFGAITLTLYNGTTEVDQYSLDNPLLGIRLLSGEDRGEVLVPASGAYDRVEIRNRAGVATLLESVDIYGASILQAAPELDIPDPIEICEGEEYIVSAVPAAGTVLRWYDSEEKDNLLYSGSDFEVPSDVAGEFTYFIEVVDEASGCPNPELIEFDVIVNDAPGTDAIVVEAGSDAYCEGESVGITATAAGIDDPVFTWYLDENKEDPVADADGVSYKISNGELEISGLPVGEHTYYVSVSDGADGCESIAGDLAEVSVTVNAGATQSDIVTAGSVICFGETATLEASSNTIDNPVFNWYENADLEDAPFTGAIFEQEDLAAGEHTYYVTVSGDGVCESSAEEAVAVIIEVQHQITSDDIELPGGLSQCLGSEVMLSAGVAAGLDVDTPEFTWYLDAEGTQELSDGELDGATYTINNGELTIDGLTTGDINYYVGLDGDNVCGSLDGGLAMVTVSIGEDLAAPEVAATEVSVCIGEDTTLSILNPQDNLTYNWYTEESGGTVEFTGSDVDLTDVTEDATYYVEAVGDGGCESLTRTQVTVIVNDYATAADIEVTGETSVCEGTDVVLTPSSAIADPVIRWYEDADKLTEITEGVAANGVLTVSGLEAGDYTFYASVEGAELCENEAGDLAEIAINVGSAQEAPVVTPPEQYVIVGETPEAFEVVDLDSGEAVWYSDADLSTEVARGNSYVPSSGSEGSFTYYVVVEEGPCVSEVTEVVLHVTGMPTPPEECYIADGESHGTTFGCVLCSVQDPTHAIDDNPDNFSRLVLPIGLGSGSVYQTLEFSHMGKAGDSVVVDMALPGGLADVNIFGAITLTLYNGTTEVDQYSLDNPLLGIRLLSGEDRGEVLVPASGAYDRVEIRNRAGVATLLESVDIYGASILQAAPELDIPDPIEICEGEEYIVSAVPAAGTVLRWYDSEEKDNLLYSGSDFEVPSDVAGEFTYFIEVVDEASGCPNPELIEFDVIVNDAPGTDAIVVEAGSDAYCEGESVGITATAAGIDDPVFTWYLDENKEDPVADADGVSYKISNGELEISGLPVGEHTYYVSVSDGADGCESIAGDLAEVSVTVNAGATQSDITVSDSEICLGESIELTASSAIENAMFRFYADAELTEELADTEVSPEADTTYYVTVSGDGVCENAPGEAASIMISVNDGGTPTTDLLEQEFCETAGAVVADLEVNEDDVVWYADAEGGDPLAMDTLLEEGMYYAGFDPATGCASVERLAVDVLITPSATASDITVSDSEICLGESIELTASSAIENAMFRFYADAELTEELADTEVSPEADTTYYVTVSGDGVCENAPGEAASIMISVNNGGTPTTDFLEQEFCETAGAVVADLEVNETDVVWYAEAEGGDPLAMDTLLEEGMYYAGFDPATGCASVERLAVDVLITPSATASDITVSDSEICLGESIELTASSAIENAMFRFYADAELTEELTDTEVSPEADTTYYVTVSGDGVCENAPGEAASIMISVNDGGTPTTDLLEQEFCETAGAVVADLEVNEDDVVWYAEAEGGDPLAMDTLLEEGMYYAGFDPATGCASVERLAVDVLITPSATASDITVSDSEICLGESIELTASSAIENAMFRFYADAELTEELTDTEVSPEADTTYYVTVSGDGVCENAPDEAASIMISVNDGGTPTTDQLTQEFCETAGAVVADLEVNEDDVGWYADAEGGDPLVMDTLLEEGMYYAGFDPATGCASVERLAVDVLITPSATASDITVSDSEICLGESIELTASSAIENAMFRFYADAELTEELADTEVSPEADTTYYVTVSGDGVCENAPGEAASIMISVNNGGTPTTDFLEQEFCETAGAVVADLEVNETDVVWYAEAEGGDPLAMDTLLEEGMYYAGFDPATGCASVERLAVDVLITPSATASDITVSDSEICLGESIELTASSAIENAMFRFYADAELTEELADTEVSPEADTTYYVTVSGDGVCENAPGEAASIMISVNDGGTPTTDHTEQGFCAVNKPIVADLEVNEADVEWYAEAEGGDPLAMDTLLEEGMYYAGFISDGDACASSKRLAVEVIMNENSAEPGDIIVNDAEICLGESHTLSASSDIPGANIKFYSDAGLTSEIDDLEVTPEEDTTYYVTVSGDGVCENAPGDAATLTITVNESGTPTTQNPEQEFCETSGAVVADLEVNESNVVWYAEAEGGAPLAMDTLLEEGTYYAGFDPASACESETRLAVDVRLTQDDTGAIEGNTTMVCIMEQETYTTSAGMEDYVWMIEGGEIIEGGGSTDDYVTVSWYEAEENYLSVSYLDDNSCSGEIFATLDVEVITCSDIAISKTVNDETPVVGDEITFTITVNNDGDYPYEHVQVRDELPAGYRYISSNASHGSYSTASNIWEITDLPGNETATLEMIVEVLPEEDYTNVAALESSTPTDPNDDNNEDEASIDPICLTVYNEFSPNGDGSNDYFWIDCIEQYPSNVLKIYNRYGNLVFETSGYENDWDGTANKGSIRHDRLPVGTYFYVLELEENNTVKKGWLYLMR